ncbi:MAG: MXAN_5187 C-terminal domain-containing protein [Myxococcaceae bacterium]
MAVQRSEADPRIPESEALARELEELELALTELKAHYEQYFLGVDRQPPTKADVALRQRLAKLRGGQPRSAVLKFRTQALQQRFTTYDRLWQRTLSEMENGTYRRDLFKARRRRKTGETPAAAVPASAPAVAPPPLPSAASVPTLAGLAPTASQTSSGAPRVAPPPLPLGTQGGAVRPGPVPAVAPITIAWGTQPGVRRPAAPIPPGTQGAVARAAKEALTEPRLRAVYEAYLAAKRSCQEDVSRLSYESVADSLRKQVPELLERHGARDVEYKVVVKDGKAVLRAVPKS